MCTKDTAAQLKGTQYQTALWLVTRSSLLSTQENLQCPLYRRVVGTVHTKLKEVPSFHSLNLK